MHGPCDIQCLRYKILPSGLCAEICCNRGKKGLSGRIGTFSGPILEQIGTFCHYLHQNAELLKIMRKHDNPISRREKSGPKPEIGTSTHALPIEAKIEGRLLMR